jgi:hypothetical protein
MEIRNFSEFLLEKKKDKDGEKVVDTEKKKEEKKNSDGVEIWKPGSGPWYLQYISQIKSESDQERLIKITEEDVVKLGEKFSEIDSSMKWEKLYQFAKYCLSGKEEDYPSRYRDQESEEDSEEPRLIPGLITNILDLKVEGKTIKNILKKVTNKDLSTYTDKMYSAIKVYIKDLPEKDSIKYFDKKVTDFNDLSTVLLLAGLYQPRKDGSGQPIFTVKDKSLPVFTESKGWNQADKEEKESIDSKKLWPDSWSIPIDPVRIESLVRNAEMCVRCSLSCIKEISLLMSEAAQKEAEGPIGDLEKKLKDINALREGGKNSSGTEVKDYILGKEDEAEGSQTGKIYSFWRDNYDKENKKIKNPSKSIEGSTGFTGKMNTEFLNNFKEAKKLIDDARSKVDEGKFSSKEYFSNIAAYSEDQEGKSVEIGEGLKKVMFEEIKEGIADLQAAIDSYTSGSGEKNALDQYLKVYKQFIDKIKEGYTLDVSSDGKTKKIKA